MAPEVKSTKLLASLLRESRRLARRKRRKLSPSSLAELAALHAAAQEALSSEDPSRIEEAHRSLEGAFETYLLPHRKSVLRVYAETLVIAGLLAFAFRTTIVEAHDLSSSSMAPTLLPGDLVLVFKSAYGLRLPGVGSIFETLPGRGDVILYESPGEEGRRAVHRVVGLPNETLHLVDRVLHIEGEAQELRIAQGRFEYWSYREDLDYWHPRTGSVWVESLEGSSHATLSSRLQPTQHQSDGPFVVPEGHVFVLGDNRDHADDGRARGGWFLPVENIRGKVWFIALSIGPEGRWFWGDTGLRPWRVLRPLDRLGAFREP